MKSKPIPIETMHVGFGCNTLYLVKSQDEFQKICKLKSFETQVERGWGTYQGVGLYEVVTAFREDPQRFLDLSTYQFLDKISIEKMLDISSELREVMGFIEKGIRLEVTQ